MNEFQFERLREMMFCYKCGSKLSESMDYCYKCGVKTPQIAKVKSITNTISHAIEDAKNNSVLLTERTNFRFRVHLNNYIAHKTQYCKVSEFIAEYKPENMLLCIFADVSTYLLESGAIIFAVLQTFRNFSNLDLDNIDSIFIYALLVAGIGILVREIAKKYLGYWAKTKTAKLFEKTYVLPNRINDTQQLINFLSQVLIEFGNENSKVTFSEWRYKSVIDKDIDKDIDIDKNKDGFISPAKISFTFISGALKALHTIVFDSEALSFKISLENRRLNYYDYYRYAYPYHVIILTECAINYFSKTQA